MRDEQYIAAEVVRATGLLGYAALIALNAGGLALMVATAGPWILAAIWLGGLAAALVALLVTYGLAEVIAMGADASFAPGAVLWAQLGPALLSAALFFWGAFGALQTLT